MRLSDVVWGEGVADTDRMGAGWEELIGEHREGTFAFTVLWQGV